ncbi:hypothetical protein CAAN1_23S00408 [[Candida] anglica]|uniref:Uncharacterized protein n=1 Tax=[Candida] anglica TaxID=148631 RepID=A0ABP0ECM8_9ASCO
MSYSSYVISSVNYKLSEKVPAFVDASSGDPGMWYFSDYKSIERMTWHRFLKEFIHMNLGKLRFCDQKSLMTGRQNKNEKISTFGASFRSDRMKGGKLYRTCGRIENQLTPEVHIDQMSRNV